MQRRGFLTAMLAAGTAPAVVRADSLMKIFVPPPEILRLWGDGIHDDTAAMQAFFDCRLPGVSVLNGGKYFLSSAIFVRPDAELGSLARPRRLTNAMVYGGGQEYFFEIPGAGSYGFEISQCNFQSSAPKGAGGIINRPRPAPANTPTSPPS